jgi:putative tricarboxylic transport membrane protein
MRQPAAEVVRVATDRVIPRLVDITRYWRTVLRSGVIGTTMGIIPGVGEDLGAWASYAAARRASRERAAFGKGSVEGLMAAENGNNAAVPGPVIPVLRLAVPGSAPAAVLLAAMFIHGVRPGPLIMIEFPTFISEVVAMMLLAGFGTLIYGLLLTRPLLYVLAVPRERLMPLIFVLCTIGSFAIASRLFDVYVMLGFGFLGFVVRTMNYPMAPLVLGLVLGDILDKSLRRGLVLSDGGLGPFFTRPISLVLWVTIVITVALSFQTVRDALGRLLARRAAQEPDR